MKLSQRHYFLKKEFHDLALCDDITKYPLNSLSAAEWMEIMHYIKRAEVEAGADGLSKEFPSTHYPSYLLCVALDEYKKLVPELRGSDWELYEKALDLLDRISDEYETIDVHDPVLTAPAFDPVLCFALVKK